MRRLLLVCAILFWSQSAQAAITLFGVASTPADTGSNTGATVTITPPGSMVSGHVVIVIACSYDNGSVGSAITNTTSGGQTWATDTAMEYQRSANIVGCRAFSCVFNGTWGANPVFTGDNTPDAIQAVMTVWAGVDSSKFDVSPVSSDQDSPDSPADVTIAAITTNTNNALALFVWGYADDATWVLQTGGWSQTGLSAQYAANSSFFDTGISIAYKVQASAGTTGSVTNRASLIAQPMLFTMALKEAASAATPKLRLLLGVGK